MTFKFIIARVPHTQWTITHDLHLWQILQHVVGSQQWALLAYTVSAQTNRGCFYWTTAQWTQWPQSPLLSAEHCSTWEPCCKTERKLYHFFIPSLLLEHELQLYETIWQAIKNITKYEIQVSIRSISMSGFIKRNTKNKPIWAHRLSI